MTQDNLINLAMSKIKLPDYAETYWNNKPWVRYGVDNQFPVFLQELANKSALHNAIISSKVDYSYANGLDTKNVYNEAKVADFSTLLFINHPNPYEDLNSIYRKCIYDYILYGGFCLNVIWAKDRENISEIYHIDFSKVRAGKKDEREQVKTYYYCEDWSNTRKYGYKEVDAYIPNHKKGSQLLYVKEYRPGTFYYPLPSYVGALNYISIDCEISNFHLAHIINGMTPNMMISFCNGIPTEEERRRIKQQFVDEFTGSDNAGKFFVTFSEDKERVPQLTTISADNLDEQFIQLQATVLQNILSGHKVVSPMLVGIKTEGQLGGNTELETSFEIFNNTVIKPIQKEVTGVLNRLLSHTLHWNGTEVVPTDATPVSFTWSENILSQILTPDEMREKIGIDKKDNITE